MPHLLDITSSDIQQLNDADLRNLIGKLCEADYSLAGLSTIGITWSGHQDAADGGLDVIVRGKTQPPILSFIPRSIIGFQVKKSDMSSSKIKKEILPKGLVRPSIVNLINDGGAYIIVSSGASLADARLQERISAMSEALEIEANYNNLHIDFFDSNRIASWVNRHPSLILWIRHKIGRPFAGWYSYDNWSNCPQGIQGEYLIDNCVRMYDANHSVFSIKDGLLLTRTSLIIPRTCIRLVGLSGVGKTRFVQALFDERVGEQAIDKSIVCYADMSNSLDPDPNSFLQQLIAKNGKAIVIIDNCSATLHRDLAIICRNLKSNISLLTVEYDVGDDLPEDTSILRLEPASDELIKELIKKNFTHISEVDVKTIAKFSGGNARIATYLSNTIKIGENLSGLQDEELFKRLVWQRHEPNERLMRSAEVCSLVYSFDGEDTSSENSEFKLLASILNIAVNDLFRDLQILKERNLVQSRGQWRALLPDAIANRLARKALESIPKHTITETFLNNAPDRLIKSFAGRLGYLHDCEPAIKIVNGWLDKEGCLGSKAGNFTNLEVEVLSNIASTSPSKILDLLARTENIAPRHINKIVKLLWHIAYDEYLFERCIKLLCSFTLLEAKPHSNSYSLNALKSLFYIIYSGTNAPAKLRAKVIEELLNSNNSTKQLLGLELLDAALEATHIQPSTNYNFGARPRDYGLKPNTHIDVNNWYKEFGV